MSQRSGDRWNRPITRGLAVKLILGSSVLLLIAYSAAQLFPADNGRAPWAESQIQSKPASMTHTAAVSDAPAPHNAPGIPDRDAIARIVMAEMGPVNREGVKRISRIDISDMGDGMFRLRIVFAGDDNFGTAAIRHQMLKDICLVAATVRDRYPKVGFVEMNATFAFTDAYGNSSEDEAMDIGLDRATLIKTNFKGIRGDDILRIAMPRRIAPALMTD